MTANLVMMVRWISRPSLLLWLAAFVWAACVVFTAPSMSGEGAGNGLSAGSFVSVAEAAATTTPPQPSSSSSSFNDTAPVFTFGYLRMSAIDAPSAVAGLMSTIAYYNKYSVSGVHFRLNVTVIPCMTTEECRDLSPAHHAILDGFLARMPAFTAVFRPNAFLALPIVEEAQRIGGCPIINPDAIRMSTFGSEYPNVINFKQNWASQGEHLFTYMHQTARCAHSGIVYGHISGTLDDEYARQVKAIQELFADGDYAIPPVFEAQTAALPEFYDFFLSDSPRRRCFIVLGTASLMQSIMVRLRANSTFNPVSFFFFGVSMMMSDTYSAANPEHYSQTYFTHWVPRYKDTSVVGYGEWYGGLTAEDTAALLDPQEALTIPSTITMVTYESYAVVRLTLEVLRAALSSVGVTNLNASSGLPIAWSTIIDAFYGDARMLDRHPLNFLVRDCPLPPAAQLCFCNSLTADGYIYGVNNVTGFAYMIDDEVEEGQRNMAHVTFPGQCGYTASSWSYPIVSLALYPDYLVGLSYRDDIVTDSYRLFQEVFGIMTRDTNYEPTPPTRALRYAAYDVSDDPATMQSSLNHYIDTLQPFIIYGSLVNPIRKAATLTLLPKFIGIDVEDPPLTSVDEWQSNILQLIPSLADYIHAIANYYSVNEGRFTAIHGIASTQREAELISMSFATWGYDVPVATILVSESADVWAAHVTSVLSDASSYRPFVLAASTEDPNSVIEAVAAAAASVGRGTVGIACSNVAATSARAGAVFGGGSDADGDVVFGAFRREWWLPSAYDGVPAELHDYVGLPRYHVAMLAMQFSRQLYSQVYYDYKKTAAQVLYGLSVVSASDTSFGPFYNETCSKEEIAANTRDRRCQCTKGVRTIFVHSVRDAQEGVASGRTSQHSWTMTQCGVVYRAYVPPVVPLSSTLAAGAIAGIAVGGCALILGIVCYVVYTLCFAGRDNSAAPKDASQPFAIVFTDIQSSTALWARAPNAMSEAIDQHHRLIRKAVRSHKGYEVKTVGDSFMVAFKRTEDAVRFSLEVQLLLFEASWSGEIDATYIELLLEAEAAAAESVADDDDVSTANRQATTNTTTNGPSQHHQHHQHPNNAHNNNNNTIVKSIYASDTASATHSLGFSTHQHQHQHTIHTTGIHSAFSNDGNAASGGANANAASGGVVNVRRGFNNSTSTTPKIAAAGGLLHPMSTDGAAQHFPLPPTANINAINAHGNAMEAAGERSLTCMSVHTFHAANDADVPPQQQEGVGGGGQAHHGPAIDVGAIVEMQSLGRSGVGFGATTGGNRSLTGGNRSVNREVSLYHHGGSYLSLGANAAPSPTSKASPTNGATTRRGFNAAGGGASPTGQPLLLNNPISSNLTSPSNRQHNNTHDNNNGSNHNPMFDLDISVAPLESPTAKKGVAAVVFPPSHRDASFVSAPTPRPVCGMLRSGSSAASAPHCWNGLRVRIGIHYGLGDIRKDPVSQGYDYYGTVVNTAARVEGVGHGGQILLTDAAYEAVGGGAFLRSVNSIMIALGPQPLRGLDEPLKLFQLVPDKLQARQFPALRLHIEKETEDESNTDASGTIGTSASESPEVLITRLCAMKQFSGISPEEMLDRYLYMTAAFAPCSDKFKMATVVKLAELWGFERAAKEAKAGTSGKTRMLVNLTAKVTKAFNAQQHQQGKAFKAQQHQQGKGGRRRGSSNNRRWGGGGGGGGGTNASNNNNNNATAYSDSSMSDKKSVVESHEVV